jgi:metallopeptidase MepB
MAKTPETVNEFLDDLRTQLAPGGKKEIEHLMEIKTEYLKSTGMEASNDGNYYLWDSRFYHRLMVEKEYSIDEQKIAEYFPLQSTIEGMLDIFQNLFGFVFVELDAAARANISGKFRILSDLGPASDEQ